MNDNNIGTVDTSLQQPKPVSLKRNLILKVIGGQRIRLEDVLDYAFDAHGLHVTRQDVSEERKGDKVLYNVQVLKMWFNPAGILDFTEEYVKG